MQKLICLDYYVVKLECHFNVGLGEVMNAAEG